MCESEKKEEQTPSEQPKASEEKDGFVEALKKGGDEGLKEAFRYLSKDKPTARVEDGHLRSAVEARDPKISVQNAEEIIKQVNGEGLFSCDEFVKTIKMILAMKKDMSDGGLQNAFNDIRQGESSIRVEDVRLAIVIRSPEFLVGNAKEIIEEANKGGFNSKEFVEIFKLLKDPGEANPTEKTFEDPGEANPTEKTFNKLVEKIDDGHEIILHGEKGVGKTWTAREAAARAVRRRGGFDAAIWVYLNRSYDEQELSLQKSIAHQLSVLGDFEEFVAKEAKKKAEEEEAKKKEPEAKEAKKKAEEEEAKKKEHEKNESRDVHVWVDVGVAKKEADRRKEEIERLIRKALEGKRLLIVRDGDGDGDGETRTKAEIKIEKKEQQPQKEKQKGGDEEKKDEGGEKSNDEVKNKQEQGEEKVDEKKEIQVVEILFLELKRGDEVVKLELLKSYKGSLKHSYKLLTTTARKHQGGAAGEYEIIVKPFTWEASKSMATGALKREKVKEKLATQAVESEEVKKIIKELKELARYFMFRSKRLPSELLLISRIVAYFGAKGESGLQELRSKRDTIKKGQGTGLFDVLIQGYEERLPKSVLIDCYSPKKPDGHFMYRGRAVSFNELICYWIMEGYLGRSDHVDELYLKGHRVLMELMDCGLLQKQEADYVAPSGTTSFRFHIYDYQAFFIDPRPGIGITFDMSLGRVALGDGRIGTIDSKSDDGKDQIISTLLLDGNRISDEERTAETLSKYKDRVEILAITNPTSQHFKLPILEMTKLRLLALRRCQFLGSLEDFRYKKPDPVSAQSDHEKPIERETDQTPQKPPPQTQISEKLEKLTVLEISGPCEVESIPDDFFGLMPNLKTVNLSHLEKIQALPPSFYNLEHIEFLILRGCSSLKQLGSLKKFKELKVLDVSDATTFEKFEDKSLQNNTKLQILNLSKTSLKILPLINKLKELKFVWLRDCKVLPRIRKIDEMRGLKIFDIAGAGDVERFCDPSLEDLSKIVIVDISGTHIRRIPANIGDPTYLYARDCPKLKVVPPVEGLTKLEVLDLSGCHRLKELRQEFFEKLKDVIRVLNLSNTRVEDIPFLSSLTSLQELVLSECKYLKKVEKLSCLEKMETLDLSGCEKVTELEEGSFDKMINLKVLNLSRTAIGALPSLSKLQSLEELYVRDCPNLNKLPGVEEARNLKVLDYSGTVLESPPSFKDQEKDHLKVVGEGIESINTTDLLKHLGFQNFVEVEDERWTFKQEDVSHCKWIISNSLVDNEEEKLGTPVYGAHFLRLLKEHPYILAKENFCFLVYPSEAEAKIKARFPDKNSYGEEVGLREIYLGQVCEKMEKCVEIREFNELPESLRPLLAEAQFVVLVDDTFLKTLLDLRVDSTMPMKACWIESCNELLYVVEEVKKPEGEAKSEEEEEQKKNAAATVGGEGDKLKKTAEAKAGEEGKVERDQQKNSAVEKAGETAKSEEGDQPKSEESGKGGGDEQKAGAEEKSEDPAKTNEADQSETGATTDNAGESGKGEGGGDEQKAGAVEKSEDPAKTNEGNQSDTGAAADNAGESGKGGGDEQKAGVEEKSEDPAKTNEVDQSETGAAANNAGESGKGEGGGDEQKAGVEEKSEDPAKANEVDQSETGAAADNAAESGKGESGGNEQKAGVEEKSEDPAKTNEGDHSETGAPADNAGESGKGEDGGDQQKSNAAEEKTPEPAINEGGEKKEKKADDKAKSGGDQTAADDAKDSAKIEGDQEKNSTEQKPVDSGKKEGDQTKNDDEGEAAAKIKGDEEKKEKKNAAEDLNNLQTLWISDASKMISICKGDISSVSFIFLKSLYLEFCPNLTAICASSSQLPILETLFIKYCQNLNSLFEDQNPSKLENLKHLQLWGLDSLQKINCDTPSLLKLRVGECPLLEHLLSSRKHGTYENEGHEHLRTLHIKSCDKLKEIFEEQQPDVVFEKLEELELSGLPEMEKVAKAAPSLLTLRVEECPSLGSVISGEDGAPVLQTLEVRSCERMKTVVGGGKSDLKEIKLLGLPELEHVGPELPGDVEPSVWACPKYRSF